MKKIVLALASLLCFSAVSNAQSMKVYQDGELKAVYHVSKNDKIEFSGDFPFPGDDKPTENGHEYVDLGLPSGLKWATCNVGATKPEEYGDYFAWGDTEPYYTEGHSQDSPCSNWKNGKSNGYDWSSYKWCNGSYSTLFKYCTSSSYGTVDNKTVLDPEDDAAAVNWGGLWRMPTKAEQDELRTKCIWSWTTKNGVKGYNVVGPNGNSIFLPASGYRSDRYRGNVDVSGHYWSSSLSNSGTASLDFDSGDVFGRNDGRCYGHSVRPVCPNPDFIRADSIQITGEKTQLAPSETLQLSATVAPSDATNASVTWSSSKPSVATVSADGLVTAVATGSATITATANDGSGVKGEYEITVALMHNVHDYVDLGLPSGLKWATCNVGATKPEEYGDYFAWGETTGKQSGKTTFDWSTYKWCNGSQTTMTKYCSSSSYGKVDNKTVLDAEDDAATANWGKGWRMPTLAEFQELRNSCTWTWTTLNGVKGYKVVGTNGNFIFLPAAGSYEDKGAYRIGAAGTYWTSSLGTVGSSHAFDIDFDYGGCYIDDNDYRFFYQSVRPVCQ